MPDTTPTIRFAAPVYPGGRHLLICGAVAVGAVFPTVGNPPNKWAWGVWVNGRTVSDNGLAKDEARAKAAAMSAFNDFLAAAGLMPKGAE